MLETKTLKCLYHFDEKQTFLCYYLEEEQIFSDCFNIIICMRSEHSVIVLIL